MDMKTLRTGQEQFVSTANHWTKVSKPMYSVLTRETVGGMIREFSLRRFRSTCVAVVICCTRVVICCTRDVISLESLFSSFQPCLGFFDHTPLDVAVVQVSLLSSCVIRRDGDYSFPPGSRENFVTTPWFHLRSPELRETRSKGTAKLIPFSLMDTSTERHLLASPVNFL